MSVQDFIKKSILQSDNYATQSPFRIVIVLLLALLIGAFIYKVYQHFFTGVIYSRSFAMTLVGMTLLTSMVTLCNQFKHRYLTWYGRCPLYRPLPYRC